MTPQITRLIDPSSPVLVVQSFLKAKNQRPKSNFSGIGFLYRKNADGSYLLVTCGHFFWPEIFDVPKGSDLFITKDYGTDIKPAEDNFLPFEIIDGPKFAKNVNEDIAIFTVRPQRPVAEDFKLFEPLENQENIPDAGSVSLAMVNKESVVDVISQDSSKKYHLEKYNFKSRAMTLTVRGTTLAFRMLGLGATRYPCYQIFSDFGASGSPIWTNEGKLFGMNLGGEPGVWTAVVTPKQIDSVIKELGL